MESSQHLNLLFRETAGERQTTSRFCDNIETLHSAKSLTKSFVRAYEIVQFIERQVVNRRRLRRECIFKGEQHQAPLHDTADISVTDIYENKQVTHIIKVSGKKIFNRPANQRNQSDSTRILI